MRILTCRHYITFTYRNVNVYWPGHHTDVREWCAKCDICASRKSPPPKAKAPLKPIVAIYPMQLVAMDIVGPFPESEAGNSYVLVVADYFTRYTEAYSIANQEATTVATKLVDEFFVRFSPLNSYTQIRGVTSNPKSCLKYARSWELVNLGQPPIIHNWWRDSTEPFWICWPLQ